MEDLKHRNCLHVKNPPAAERDLIGSTHWNTPECCLRTSVGRFPPYIDFAGDVIYPDYDVEVFHMCGSLAETFLILTAAVNCSCLVNVDYLSDIELLSAVEKSENGDGNGIFEGLDFQMLADYSYIHPKLQKHQEQYYPLGSVSLGSVLGRENPTAPPGIKIVKLYTPAVWTGFWISLSALTFLLSLISFQIKCLTKNFLRPRKVHVKNLLPCIPMTFLDILGMYYGQNLGPDLYTGTKHVKRSDNLLSSVKNGIILLWSLLSALILAKTATSDLLEILLHSGGTDRFKSMADLVSRTSAEVLQNSTRSEFASNFIVAYFTRSYIDYAIENGDVKLGCHALRLISDEEVSEKIMGLLDPIRESCAVIVGVAATLTIIRHTAIHIVGCAECEDFMYVQEDESYSVPYYITTVPDHWPADKRKTWRRTTARLLESGLPDFYYRRELYTKLPDFVIKKDQEAAEKSYHKLKTVQISLWSVHTIVLLLLGLILVGGAIMLLEVNLHSAHQLVDREKTSTVYNMQIFHYNNKASSSRIIRLVQ